MRFFRFRCGSSSCQYNDLNFQQIPRDAVGSRRRRPVTPPSLRPGRRAAAACRTENPPDRPPADSVAAASSANPFPNMKKRLPAGSL
jgi:hypothetical protein